MIDRSNPLSRNIVALWPFNEAAGKRSNDTSGRGLHVTAGAAATWAGGAAGNAVSLNGTADSWDVANVSFLSPPFTVAARFRWNNSGSANPAVISHDSNANNGWRLQIVGGNLSLTFGNVAIYDLGLPAAVDVWYTGLITCTANGGTAVGYLKNVNKGGVSTGSQTVGTVFGTPNRFNIGRVTTGFMGGAVELAALWNRVLSNGEARDFLRDPYSLFLPLRLTRSVQAVAAGGFQPAWARGANRLISGGVMGG